MAIWHSKIVQDITGGELTSEWEGNNLTINSNDVSDGDIFVALPGEKLDGHDFVKAALQNGAVAAIVKNKVDVNIPQLIVPDVYEAIKKMADYKRKTVKAKYIAITGSVGKTTTKEMLTHCLKAIGTTYATKGNFNNHLGLPLTLASIPNDAEYVICELGMSAAGEMEELSLMVQPDYAIITNIYPVHKEFFSTIDDIALAKAEIFKGMSSSGIAILNANNEYYHILKSEADKLSIASIACGNNTDCQILKSEIKNENSSQVDVNIFNKHIKYELATNSSHLIDNSLLVVALLELLQVDLNQIKSLLANFSDCSGRGELLKVKKMGHDITIINDCYNSSPESLRAALKRLKLFDHKRKIAVLSDMLELGVQADEYHSKIAEDISANEIDQVITYGKHMYVLFTALPSSKQMYHAKTLDDLAEFITKNIQTNDLILFKGSHGTGLHKITKLFKE